MFFILLATMFVFCTLPEDGQACGLVWHHAHSEFHFENVDNQGNVFLIQRLGEMESVQGQRFPFYALFKSDSGNRSPFIGYGWCVPLLESKIIQTADNQFCLYQPDGFKRVFWRSKDNPNILQSRNVWSAEIRGDVITARCWCKSNGNRLVFLRGRLTLMETQGEIFDYTYENNRVSEIRQGGRTILKAAKSPITGAVVGLTLLNGQNIGLELAQRPQIQDINERGRFNPVESLGAVIFTNNVRQTFEYGVDAIMQHPTLRIDGREIMWDGFSHKIIRDGEWYYSITSDVIPGENAAISRDNARGEKEFWHKNNIKGEEITRGIDGITHIKTWFTSGKLRGRVRKEMQIINGVKSMLCEYSYDEKGRLIRILRDQTDSFFVFEDDGELAAVVMNGEIVRCYTTNGTFLAHKYVN